MVVHTPEVMRCALEDEEPTFLRASNSRQAARRAICDADDWRKMRRALGSKQGPKMDTIKGEKFVVTVNRELHKSPR